MQITEKEYADALNKSYTRGWQDAMDFLSTRNNCITNIPSTPAHEDSSLYEKAPYWMNPAFRLEPSVLDTHVWC